MDETYCVKICNVIMFRILLKKSQVLLNSGRDRGRGFEMDTAAVGTRAMESVLAKPGVGMAAGRMLGSFRDDPTTRREFLAMTGSPGSGSNGF